MNTRDIVARICNLPVDFKTMRTLSVIDLVRDSGYLTDSSTVNVQTIVEYLREHEDLIEAWLTFSDDQRCAPSWYFSGDKDGKWIVGFLPASGRIGEGERLIFEDRFVACANFIVREIEQVSNYFR